MNKYTPLVNYLRTQPPSVTQLTLTFAQIEDILGDTLAPSAYNYFRSWDDNQDTSKIKAILIAGFHVVMVDKENQKVKFQRM